eukprot:1161239-Pelagomonas_calceolata.AAC.5
MPWNVELLEMLKHTPGQGRYTKKGPHCTELRNRPPGTSSFGSSAEKDKKGQSDGEYEASKPHGLNNKIQVAWYDLPSCPLRKHWLKNGGIDDNNKYWHSASSARAGRPAAETPQATAPIWLREGGIDDNKKTQAKGKKHKERVATWQQGQKDRAAWQQRFDKNAEYTASRSSTSQDACRLSRARKWGHVGKRSRLCSSSHMWAQALVLQQSRKGSGTKHTLFAKQMLQQPRMGSGTKQTLLAKQVLQQPRTGSGTKQTLLAKQMLQQPRMRTGTKQTLLAKQVLQQPRMGSGTRQTLLAKQVLQQPRMGSGTKQTLLAKQVLQQPCTGSGTKQTLLAKQVLQQPRMGSGTTSSLSKARLSINVAAATKGLC